MESVLRDEIAHLGETAQPGVGNHQHVGIGGALQQSPRPAHPGRQDVAQLLGAGVGVGIGGLEPFEDAGLLRLREAGPLGVDDDALVGAAVLNEIEGLTAGSGVYQEP